MAWTLKESDIKSLLKWARSDTKKLVIAGIKGKVVEFAKILVKYNFFGTLDSSMASIIIAFIICCIKSKDPDLKKFGLSALRDGSSLNKLFEYLKEGDGKKVKYYMGSYFQAALGTVLQTALPDDKDNGIDNKDKRAKIIKSFINQAGKITPWGINKKDVSNILHELIGKISKTSNILMMDEEGKKAEKIREAESMFKEKLINERKKEFKEIKPDVPDTAEIEQALKSQSHNVKLIKERYGELEKVKSDFTPNKKSSKKAANEAIKFTQLSLFDILLGTDAFFKPDLEIARRVTRLLDHGANPNVQNEWGITPLHVATENIKPNTVKLLLDRGADPNIQDNRGCVPLHYVAAANDKKMLELLLDYRVDPNIQNDAGNTPLHYVAIHNNKGIYNNLLIKHGANPDIKNKKGETPKEIMERNTKK
ncbi:MAG: ankyrin repeat domain-containing protein [Clostridia bacterium]|nr:ankyrin repeat domain-containing protein [Clostridia bacterium]